MSAHVPLCVYVLTPCLAPRHLLKSYVGFSNNPLRRIRKHNGEIQGGARRTREHRPWEFAAVVAGLPSKSLALQLEWALQHPKRGLKTRAHVAVLQGKRGIGAVGTVRRKMTELRLILTQCEPWKG
jgi:structure-specific endonuclease subunit SLX1